MGAYGERRALGLVAVRALRRGAGAKCQRRRARIASRRRRRVGRELRPVGVRPPRADATKFLFPPRGRALEEASRASGLGLPGDGIAGPRDGVERGHGRELQRHGPMSRARGTVYVPTATAGRFRGGAAGGTFINLHRTPTRPLKPACCPTALVS